MLLSLQRLLKKQKNSPAQAKASLNRKYMNKLTNLIAAFGCAGKALIFVIIFFLLAFSYVLAESEETRSVTIMGEAELKIVPDEIIFYLGVETCEKDLKFAMEKNDKIVSQVFTVARSFGIEEKHIQTGYIKINPSYRYYDNKRTFLGYRVYKVIGMVLYDVSKFEAIFSQLLDTGITHVQNIQFRTTKLREYRDRARLLALEAAREKAEAMANALGQTIGLPLEIIEYQDRTWMQKDKYGLQNVVQDVNVNPNTEMNTIALGQISIKEIVQVSFELKN